jgi:hypothetical protein
MKTSVMTTDNGMSRACLRAAYIQHFPFYITAGKARETPDTLVFSSLSNKLAVERQLRIVHAYSDKSIAFISN